jgi:hypothetical protein
LLARIDSRLARLEAQAARMERAAGALPQVVATVVDTVDTAVARLGERGVDVDARVHDALALLERLTAPETTQAMHRLLEHLHAVVDLAASGMLDREPLRVINAAGRALAEASRRPAGRVGAFGALRALSDPDVQRSLVFLLEFARDVGKAMGDGALDAGALGAGAARGGKGGARSARAVLPAATE